MAILPIVKHPDDVLRKKAKPVTKVNAAIRKLLDDMIETMWDAPGIGLAAPQVGVSKRVIVVDPAAGEEGAPPPLQLINPEIVKAEGNCHLTGGEGCLSIPGWRGDVDRSFKIQVVALDRQGKKVYIDAEGILSIILQHEIDHLDGVLFIDKATNLRQEKPDETPEEEAGEQDVEVELAPGAAPGAKGD